MYKDLFKNKKLAIFDFDSAVVDSEILWYQSILETISLIAPNDERALAAGKKAAVLFGLSIQERIEKLVDSGNFKTNTPAKEITDNIYKMFINKLEDFELELRPGFYSLAIEMKYDKGYKLATTSNSPKFIVENIIDKVNLVEIFDCIVTKDDVVRTKPHPEMYKKVLKETKVKTKNAIAFEASPPGATAAVHSGIETAIFWEDIIPQNSFPSEVIGFTKDYNQFVRNMDQTYMERLQGNIDVFDELAKNS